MMKMTKTSGSNLPQKIVKIIWGSFFASIFSLILIFIVVGFNIFGLWGEIPDFQELENPNSAKASVIYSEDGKVLGKYFSIFQKVGDH